MERRIKVMGGCQGAFALRGPHVGSGPFLSGGGEFGGKAEAQKGDHRGRSLSGGWKGPRRGKGAAFSLGVRGNN